MNLGILMVHGACQQLWNSGNGSFCGSSEELNSLRLYARAGILGTSFSTFIAQNFGAGRYDRIHRGVRSAFVTAVVFSLLVSVLVFVFAEPLMLIFVRPDETEIIAVGVAYLRIEGAFYCGIGILFLLYGYYRAIRMPGMSVVLTVLSLGTRVVLSYWLASMPEVGVTGIWWSIPIGWLIADVVGTWCYRYVKGVRGS